MKKRLCTARAIWVEKRRYWKCNAQADGQRRSFYSTTPGKRGQKEAEVKAQAWVELRLVGDPRLCDAIAAYEEDKKKTCSDYSRKVSGSVAGTWLLVPWLEGKHLSRITLQDWQDVINTATERGRARRTLGNIRSYMIGLTAYAARRKWIEKGLEAKDIVISKQAPKKEKEILQPDGMRILFAPETDSWYVNAYRLAVAAGLRRGELVGLRWEDEQENCLRISRAINREGKQTKGKTENARRIIPMTSQIQAILQVQREKLKRNGIVSPWVFPDELGGMTKPDRMSYQWDVLKRETGMDDAVTLHGLRHTMISLYKADVPAQLLKQVVGHSVSMDTFGTYGHKVDDELGRTSRMMEARLAQVLGE